MWIYVINDLNKERIIETFCLNEFQKKNQKEFIIENVTKRKGDKLYVKCQLILTVELIKKDSIKEWIFSGTKTFKRKSES